MPLLHRFAIGGLRSVLKDGGVESNRLPQAPIVRPVVIWSTLVLPKTAHHYASSFLWLHGHGFTVEENKEPEALVKAVGNKTALNKREGESSKSVAAETPEPELTR